MFSYIAQIIIALVMITLIVLQAKGTGLSGVFGGSDNYHAKRGMEKTIFYLTIVVAVIFVALAMINAI